MRKTKSETDERNKCVIIKNCSTFTDCISETNNIQVDNAKDLDIVILIIYQNKVIIIRKQKIYSNNTVICEVRQMWR